MTTFTQIVNMQANITSTGTIKFDPSKSSARIKSSAVLHLEPRRWNGSAWVIDSGINISGVSSVTANLLVNRKASATLTGSAVVEAYLSVATRNPDGVSRQAVSDATLPLLSGMTREAVYNTLTNLTATQLAQVLSAISATDLGISGHGGVALHSVGSLSSLDKTTLASILADVFTTPGTTSVGTALASADTTTLAAVLSSLPQDAIVTAPTSVVATTFVRAFREIPQGLTASTLVQMTQAQLASVLVLVTPIDPSGLYYGYTELQLASLLQSVLANELARLLSQFGEAQLITLLSAANTTAKGNMALAVSLIDYNLLSVDTGEVNASVRLLSSFASEGEYAGLSEPYNTVLNLYAEANDANSGNTHTSIDGVLAVGYYGTAAEYGTDVVSELSVTQTESTTKYKMAKVVSNVDMTTALSAAGIMSVTVGTNFVVSSAVAQPDAYDVWVVNAVNKASSRYENFGFNSAAVLDGVMFVANGSGIHTLTGNADNDTEIRASILTGNTDLGTPAQKRGGYVYLGTDAPDPLVVTVTTDAGQEEQVMCEPSEYLETVRADMGRGLVGRYYQIRVENVDGGALHLDNMAVEFDITKRRV